ncbi:hypothetical protein MRX96_048938 [Rhipicephalus microplus]
MERGGPCQLRLDDSSDRDLVAPILPACPMGGYTGRRLLDAEMPLSRDGLPPRMSPVLRYIFAVLGVLLE